MAYTRKDVDFLRSKAARFREMAAQTDGLISIELLKLAEEVEAYAAEIEKRPELW
jgi:hypothetical protein